MIANNINTMSVTAVDTNKKIKLDPDAVLVTDNDVVVPSSIDVLPKGIPDSFSIVKYSTIPSTGFTKNQITNVFSTEEITRLKLQPDNMTIPTALLLLFPEHFPTQTNARKDTRKKRILLHKGPLLRGQDNDTLFDREKLTLARVADRAQPGDTLAIQTRMEHNYDECKNHDKEAPFTLPVVYEDDHFAIVKKPEGIVVYSHKNGGFGRENVHSCLPWVLTPPKSGVMSVMRRPQPVHRIDRGTSGLLVCAKTKPAMQDLSKQFAERRAKKTYTAIVNGDILEPKESTITSHEAINMGVCINSANNETGSKWNLIDQDLETDEGKLQSAVTIWRLLDKWSLKDARNDTVSLVELKPKTGRFHQLRKHMAYACDCPLLGDKEYDGGGLAKKLREDGFYLCSNEITLEHPYYNTPSGRKEFDNKSKKNDKDSVYIDEKTNLVMVQAMIKLPDKFMKFLDRNDAKSKG